MTAELPLPAELRADFFGKAWAKYTAEHADGQLRPRLAGAQDAGRVLWVSMSRAAALVRFFDHVVLLAFDEYRAVDWERRAELFLWYASFGTVDAELMRVHRMLMDCV